MGKTLNLTRRRLLQGATAFGAAAAAGLGVRTAGAAAPERKFLFFFAGGGWDTTTVFDPHISSSGVDMDPDTTLGTAGNLTFTAGEDRPNVTRFFQRWGRRAVICNGVNAHSVGHDSAAQFVLTGTSASSFSDWPTTLAANGIGEYPMPHAVFSGPAFPGNSGAAVVRAGGGTLLDLIDGSIIAGSDRPVAVPPTPTDTIVDAFVAERVAKFAAGRSGMGGARASALQSNLERAMTLEGRRFEAGLSDLGSDLLDQAVKATELMRLGLTRCAMIGIPGGYDSHGDETVQAPNQDAFFEALDGLFDHMAATPGLATPWLIDEVVVVALSEFGRTPLLNGGGGKDHWPFGSALVAGSGVNGNRVIGATDEGLIAKAINFQTGQASDTGDALNCENLGVTLLKLGGLDPERFLPGVQVIDALIK